MRAPVELQLQFPIQELASWCANYEYKEDIENDILNRIVPQVRKDGYLTKPDFKIVCEWKTERSKSRVENNDDLLVEEATRLALLTSHERLRIGTLMTLEGVLWPTASVILHFFHADLYPILDYRALESLGVSKGTYYNFTLWNSYVKYCRNLSEQSGLPMRCIDKALWTFRPNKK